LVAFAESNARTRRPEQATQDSEKTEAVRPALVDVQALSDLKAYLVVKSSISESDYVDALDSKSSEIFKARQTILDLLATTQVESGEFKSLQDDVLSVSHPLFQQALMESLAKALGDGRVACAEVSKRLTLLSAVTPQRSRGMVGIEKINAVLFFYHLNSSVLSQTHEPT
jgi:hypothetical protein